MGLNKQIYKPSSVYKHFRCSPVIIYLAPPSLTKSKRPYPSRHRYTGRSERLLIRDLFGLAPRRDCPFHPPLIRFANAKRIKTLGTRLCCSPRIRRVRISAGPRSSCSASAKPKAGYPLLSEDGCYPLRCSAEPGLSSHPPREENPEGEERLPNLLV